MNGLNFLPTEYKNRKANFIVGIIKNANLIIFTLNLICSFYVYKEYTKCKVTVSENNKINQDIKSIKDKVKKSDVANNIKDIKVIEIYEEISKYIDSDKIQSADISEKDIKMSVFHSSIDNYLDYIKAIENSSEFKIIDLQTPIIKEFGIENNIILKYIK